MYPTRQEAERLLKEAGKCNPGPWEDHSRVTAQCAEKIARACQDMDVQKAYVLGLLHDIGRKFGVKHLGHVYDGWQYMLECGYDEVARICLTHSFNEGKLEDYIGNFDISEQQIEEIEQALCGIEFDEYDMLIQLCDSIASAEGVVGMEERMNDVKKRYGHYPQSKWDKNMELKNYFEQKSGSDIYEIVKMR
ncbi:MAG: HD domain-containing protein [Lachnospiraceae bacterium]|nr:HD domain-containing protein [Lachnospiraceae bacterium]